MPWIKYFFQLRVTFPNFMNKAPFFVLKPIHFLASWLAFYISQGLLLAGLFLLYVVVLVPIGILWKLNGKDPLRVKYKQSEISYLQSVKCEQIDFSRPY